jgi:membrane fusion protein (multidrug efflux system)
MKNTMKSLFGLALLPLALTGCGASAESAAESAAPTEEPKAAVRTLTIRAEEITDMAVLSADLLPTRRATLATEVPGNVEILRVDIGDRVDRGSLIARIDTRALRQQVAEAEALFDQAEDRFERAEKLFAKRSITKEQQVDASASRDVAEARLASATLTLKKSDITAPWSGQISARHGKIVRLGAELDPGTRTLDVEAEIDNRDGRLRPGYFGRLEVPRQVIPDAVLVPLVAIIDFEDHQAVYVVEQSKALCRKIEVGPTVGEFVVVTSGVADGDRVIVAGLQQIVDGLEVSEEGAG